MCHSGLPLGCGATRQHLFMDITHRVQRCLNPGHVRTAACDNFCAAYYCRDHISKMPIRTLCDIEATLGRSAWRNNYRHSEGNSRPYQVAAKAHQLPLPRKGRLVLGT